MKRLFILTMLAVVMTAVSAQTKKVSILGDSYSTFKGVGPSHYAPFYPNDAFTSRPRAISWRKTTRGAALPSVAQATAEWMLRATTSLHAPTVLAILTSSSCLAAPTTPGQILLLANISMPTGARRTARVSVLHSPVCSICFRSAIPRLPSTRC